MGRVDQTRAGTAGAVLVWAALAAGILEAAALLVQVVHTGAPATGPAALLGISVAGLLARRAGRAARIASFFGAAAALLLRLVLTGLQLRHAAPAPDVLASLAGLLLAGALVYWTIAQVQAAGDLAVEAPDEPASPTTPVHSPASAPGTGRWSTATTPWPRTDENDPDATLIRPPRR